MRSMTAALVAATLVAGVAAMAAEEAKPVAVAPAAAPAATVAAAQAVAPAKAITKMVKFVDEAAAYVKKVGKDAALKEFSNPKGKFVCEDGELYIYAYDFKCVCVAHGFQPELVGKDLSDKKDSNGLLVIQKLRDTCAKDDRGFVEYGWKDPATGKEGKKLGYVVKIDDGLWLGSGIYLR